MTSSYFNSFSSGPFSSFNVNDAFGGQYDFSKLFGGSSSTGAAAGGGGLDPLSLGLGAANLGASIFSGIKSASAAKQAAKREQKTALQGLKLQQEYQKAPLAIAMANPVWQDRAAQFEFGRQLKAREFELGRGQEMFQAAQSEASRRERLAKISPEAKEAARFENLLNIERAKKTNPLGWMFGPIA